VAREDDGLLSRLAVIEGQDLAARGEAYLQLHEELRARLAGSPSTEAERPSGTSGAAGA